MLSVKSGKNCIRQSDVECTNDDLARHYCLHMVFFPSVAGKSCGMLHKNLSEFTNAQYVARNMEMVKRVDKEEGNGL